MFSRLNISDRRAEGALERATALLPAALARLDTLVRTIAAARGHPPKLHDAGRALEEIARGKLYRLKRHRSMAALLAEIGISRTTAHKWRVLARELDGGEIARLGPEAAYRRVRPRADPAPIAKREARTVARRLCALGVDAEVTPVVRGGTRRVRVELEASAWARLLDR